ncbi:MAG: iron-sulfur cluster assembly accessory protein [Deltaproteobacteria bacterium]|nr:iron-sulfur cluster assembly accessory protein [Deltaproteobacteria bacterium]
MQVVTMITVDPVAAAKAKEILAQIGKPNIRIVVLSGGCSGLEYKVEPADMPTAEDLVFEANGFQVLVERRSVIYVAGSTLTYQSSLMQSKFVLVNPNARATCSCGDSFSV